MSYSYIERLRENCERQSSNQRNKESNISKITERKKEELYKTLKGK